MPRQSFYPWQGGLDFVEMGQIKIFVQKLGLKESMRQQLKNELWARLVASKLSEQRPLTFFHRRDTENGQKRYFFAFLPITPMQKFSRGIRGCHMKADVLAIPKMW